MRLHIYTYSIYIYMYTMHEYVSHVCICVFLMCACVYVCVLACMYVCVRVWPCVVLVVFHCKEVHSFIIDESSIRGSQTLTDHIPSSSTYSTPPPLPLSTSCPPPPPPFHLCLVFLIFYLLQYCHLLFRIHSLYTPPPQCIHHRQHT